MITINSRQNRVKIALKSRQKSSLRDKTARAGLTARANEVRGRAEEGGRGGRAAATPGDTPHRKNERRGRARLPGRRYEAGQAECAQPPQEDTTTPRRRHQLRPAEGWMPPAAAQPPTKNSTGQRQTIYHIIVISSIILVLPVSGVSVQST